MTAISCPICRKEPLGTVNADDGSTLYLVECEHVIASWEIDRWRDEQTYVRYSEPLQGALETLWAQWAEALLLWLYPELLPDESDADIQEQRANRRFVLLLAHVLAETDPEGFINWRAADPRWYECRSWLTTHQDALLDCTYFEDWEADALECARHAVDDLAVRLRRCVEGVEVAYDGAYTWDVPLEYHFLKQAGAVFAYSEEEARFQQRVLVGFVEHLTDALKSALAFWTSGASEEAIIGSLASDHPLRRVLARIERGDAP